MRNGVKIALVLRSDDHEAHVLKWGDPTVAVMPHGAAVAEDPSDWLNLSSDLARALYESLARHFGGAAVDTTALRKDYDAERKRVDTFISHLTRGVTPC